ncbi:Uncharacterised protein [Mycobacteroides abscessus subsp. abscessus]|nr:Uncharacterised protein [Mycobacteroides abscessus subsp. abscessus]
MAAEDASVNMNLVNDNIFEIFKKRNPFGMMGKDRRFWSWASALVGNIYNALAFGSLIAVWRTGRL